MSTSTRATLVSSSNYKKDIEFGYHVSEKLEEKIYTVLKVATAYRRLSLHGTLSKSGIHRLIIKECV